MLIVYGDFFLRRYSAYRSLFFRGRVYRLSLSPQRKDGGGRILLASRSLTLPVFVATLVSTWYGGILGVGEYSYQYGISNWVVFGVPYYFFALVFAFFLAKKARATNLVTIPDKLFEAYDAKTSLLGALLTFVLVSPAPYVLDAWNSRSIDFRDQPCCQRSDQHLSDGMLFIRRRIQVGRQHKHR